MTDANNAPRREWTGRVVHDDDVGIGGHEREAGPYGVGARRATRRAANAVGWLPFRVVGDDDHDTVARFPRARDRAVEHGEPAESRELLGRAEAAPAPGRDHDRPRRHARNVPRSRHDHGRPRRDESRLRSSAANTKRPALVGTIDVTCNCTSGPPTRSEPPFTTTIEPSSR